MTIEQAMSLRPDQALDQGDLPRKADRMKIVPGHRSASRGFAHRHERRWVSEDFVDPVHQRSLIEEVDEKAILAVDDHLLDGRGVRTTMMQPVAMASSMDQDRTKG